MSEQALTEALFTQDSWKNLQGAQGNEEENPLNSAKPECSSGSTTHPKPPSYRHIYERSAARVQTVPRVRTKVNIV